MFDYCFELLQILEFLDDMECPLQAGPALFPPDDIDCVEYMVPVPVVERAVHCSDMPCKRCHYSTS